MGRKNKPTSLLKTTFTLRIAKDLKREIKHRAKGQKLSPSAYAAKILEFTVKGAA